MLIRYFPVDTKYGFMRIRRWSFPFSALMSVVAVLLFFAAGMNFGIDFKGGTLVELQAKAPQADTGALRERANGLGFGEVEVQEFGDGREVSVRVELQP